MQRKDLALQRMELELTRGELKNQTGQQEEQNKILRIQRFENTFFQMLTQFQEIVNGLTFSYTKDYNELEEDCIKQNKIKSNVYLLCIPVPGEMKQYLQKRQDLNFFEIEHYFGHEYLRSKDMLKEDILNCEVYEISDNKKSSFSTSVTTETEPSVFRMFTDLFKKIDQITGAQIDYDEAIKVEA